MNGKIISGLLGTPLTPLEENSRSDTSQLLIILDSLENLHHVATLAKPQGSHSGKVSNTPFLVTIAKHGPVSACLGSKAC